MTNYYCIDGKMDEIIYFFKNSYLTTFLPLNCLCFHRLTSILDKSSSYGADKLRFGIFKSLFNTSLNIILLYAGSIPYMWGLGMQLMAFFAPDLDSQKEGTWFYWLNPGFHPLRTHGISQTIAKQGLLQRKVI
jgi:hypothetical protein